MAIGDFDIAKRWTNLGTPAIALPARFRRMGLPRGTSHDRAPSQGLGSRAADTAHGYVVVSRAQRGKVSRGRGWRRTGPVPAHGMAFAQDIVRIMLIVVPCGAAGEIA
ncbi:hypothetical protein BP6252_10374 [Coleophoma cylindrospora]|uniref:Uncharacterized protein n=1 Tax=Coleophoma cylindrospora TaxID=1849047 RepID=A0A3D8QSC3_9HELO|nr:hypothetical protein BP6252_10374 [Coleophoma cylindrospora]